MSRRSKKEEVVERSEGRYMGTDGDSDSIDGRYIRFNHLLGRGAYKEVFQAFDQIDTVDVAWNQIDLSSIASSEERQRILKECKMLQKLDHPRILNIRHQWYNEKTEKFCFTTALMSSGSLRKYYRRERKINLKRVKIICGQILDALTYLHSFKPPVIHRDLKCDNIFVDGSHGDVIIGDLGLATTMPENNWSQTPMSVVGTPHWMAPELYGEKYNQQVDIWSFGMCVLELMTNKVPFSECPSAPAVYQKVSGGQKPELINEILSASAKSFIKLCLEFNPLLRPTARELQSHPFLLCRVSDTATIALTSALSSRRPGVKMGTIHEGDDRDAAHGSRGRDRSRSRSRERGRGGGGGRTALAPPTMSERRRRRQAAAKSRKRKVTIPPEDCKEDVVLERIERYDEDKLKIHMSMYFLKKAPTAVAFDMTQSEDPSVLAAEMQRGLKLPSLYVAMVEKCIRHALEFDEFDKALDVAKKSVRLRAADVKKMKATQRPAAEAAFAKGSLAPLTDSPHTSAAVASASKPLASSSSSSLKRPMPTTTSTTSSMAPQSAMNASMAAKLSGDCDVVQKPAMNEWPPGACVEATHEAEGEADIVEDSSPDDFEPGAASGSSDESVATPIVDSSIPMVAAPMTTTVVDDCATAAVMSSDESGAVGAAAVAHYATGSGGFTTQMMSMPQTMPQTAFAAPAPGMVMSMPPMAGVPSMPPYGHYYTTHPSYPGMVFTAQMPVGGMQVGSMPMAGMYTYPPPAAAAGMPMAGGMQATDMMQGAPTIMYTAGVDTSVRQLSGGGTGVSPESAEQMIAAGTGHRATTSQISLSLSAGVIGAPLIQRSPTGTPTTMSLGGATPKMVRMSSRGSRGRTPPLPAADAMMKRESSTGLQLAKPRMSKKSTGTSSCEDSPRSNGNGDAVEGGGDSRLCKTKSAPMKRESTTAAATVASVPTEEDSKQEEKQQPHVFAKDVRVKELYREILALSDEQKLFEIELRGTAASIDDGATFLGQKLFDLMKGAASPEKSSSPPPAHDSTSTMTEPSPSTEAPIEVVTTTAVSGAETVSGKSGGGFGAKRCLSSPLLTSKAELSPTPPSDTGAVVVSKSVGHRSAKTVPTGGAAKSTVTGVACGRVPVIGSGTELTLPGSGTVVFHGAEVASAISGELQPEDIDSLLNDVKADSDSSSGPPAISKTETGESSTSSSGQGQSHGELAPPLKTHKKRTSSLDSTVLPLIPESMEDVLQQSSEAEESGGEDLFHPMYLKQGLQLDWTREDFSGQPAIILKIEAMEAKLSGELTEWKQQQEELLSLRLSSTSGSDEAEVMKPFQTEESEKIGLLTTKWTRFLAVEKEISHFKKAKLEEARANSSPHFMYNISLLDMEADKELMEAVKTHECTKEIEKNIARRKHEIREEFRRWLKALVQSPSGTTPTPVITAMVSVPSPAALPSAATGMRSDDEDLSSSSVPMAAVPFGSGGTVVHESGAISHTPLLSYATSPMHGTAMSFPLGTAPSAPGTVYYRMPMSMYGGGYHPGYAPMSYAPYGTQQTTASAMTASSMTAASMTGPPMAAQSMPGVHPSLGTATALPAMRTSVGTEEPTAAATEDPRAEARSTVAPQ